ncbi:LysR family transcriptional regulator [Photobacterium frigidiphilum]|uniref:LysR family transcriptional regulator n=1 Tax=Photobacterium frigidiphilum TaxID=264736 RepID=A0A2T3J618_9GAMM|nr:LysR family transcriptional regulator [Photobacterium frigidiphilum]PSU42450.1 LysR family transcriptional regulator [Photobacterium frigidiphilum]
MSQTKSIVSFGSVNAKNGIKSMIDDIALFVSVVKSESLKSAGELLNIPASTVSRRIKNLERSLGCLLINRSSHYFNLTNEGQKLFESTRYHVESFDSIVNDFKNDVSGLRGRIKILAPLNLTTSVLQPVLSKYLQIQPSVDLELELSNELTQFSATGADFAIRVGPQRDSELTQVKLGTVQTIAVASPRYLENHSSVLNHPGELMQFDLIFSKPISSWNLYHCDNSDEHIEISPKSKRLVVNDLLISKRFVLDGLGIALLPEIEITNELATGLLTNVLPQWRGEDREVFVIWYRRQLLTRRASDLIDYLKLNCRLKSS